MLATLYDPPDLERYGTLALAEDGLHVTDIVEKARPGKEPSKEASIGRYLYTPDIFPLLQQGWEKHRKGEYFHTGALRALAREGKVVFHRTEGQRLDTGEPEGFFKSLLIYAEQVPQFKAVLDEYSDGTPRAQGRSSPDFSYASDRARYSLPSSSRPRFTHPAA